MKKLTAKNEIIDIKTQGFAVAVELARSPFGTPTPTINVRALKAAHWRKVAAMIHLVAAAVQMATPAAERWCVTVDSHSDDAGRVYLELATGDDDEAERGMRVLERVAK